MINTLHNSKREKWLKVLEYSLPALISIFIYVFAMICKGISPFGENSICYIDCSDGLIPAYTGLWDFLHGNSSFMVSFNLGAGGSLFSSFVTNGFLSPISWLIGIFPREKIIFGISLLIVVRFALMATTAYICFKKFFPQISQWILLLFSIVWTFSGWTIVHFTNIGWLDIIVLFPLLILSSKQLVENGKIFWFVLCLSYMLILSYYITYMVLVGTVIVSTVYVFTICEKENRKRVSSLLFYGIMISILISFITFIPSMITSLGGHRFTDTSSQDKSQLYEYFFSKLIVVIMYALPIVFFIRLMTKLKQDKKNVLFFMLSFIICSAGLIIEPINQMWHTGSYYCFPLRYGFVLIMILIFASLYYINTHLQADQEMQASTNGKFKHFNPSLLIGVCFGGAILTMILVSVLGAGADVIRPVKFTTFVLYLLVFILTYAVIELSLRKSSKKCSLGGLNGGIFTFIICILQVVLLMTGYLGYPIIYQENSTARVQNALTVDTSSLENGYKLKDREQLYNLNFPYLMNYASMSTWIHISSEEQYQAYSHLGYNTSSTILYSSGGTYMTDLLLGNQYVLSSQILDELYYTKLSEEPYINEDTSEQEIVYLYEMKYQAKKAFTTSVNLNELINQIDDPIEVQNAIYKALFNQVSDILTPISYDINKVTVEDNDNYDEKFVITLTTAPGQWLYINSSVNNLKVLSNGNEKTIYNGLNDFMTTTNNITIEIPLDEDNLSILSNYDLQDISSIFEFAQFDMSTFVDVYSTFQTSDVELSITKNSLEIALNNTTNDKYLFIPFVNLSNMNANINGTDCVVENALYNFMSVEISPGDNHIEITYQPKLLKPCAIISIISLLIFAIFSILNHFFKLSQKKTIIWVGTIGACIILLAVGFLVYIKPFFNTFVILFS